MEMVSLPWKPSPISRSWWAIKALFAHFPAKLVALAIILFAQGISMILLVATGGAGFVRVLWVVLMMLALPWAYGVLGISFLDAARGRKFTNREVLVHAARAVPAIWLAWLLSGMFLVTVGALLVGLGALLAPLLPGWLAMLLAVLGVGLLALLVLRLMDAHLFVLGEGAGPVQAFVLAFRRFSWGRALRVLGNEILGGIVFGLMPVLLPLLLGLALMGGTALGAMHAGPQEMGGWLTVLAATFNSIGLWMLPGMWFSGIANAAIPFGVPAAFYAEARGEELKRFAGSPPPSPRILIGYGALVAMLALAGALAPSSGETQSSRQPAASAPAPPPAMRQAAPPVSDAASHRKQAWAAWQAGDAARALVEAEAALHSSRDSWAEAATGSVRMQRRREGRAWATAMRAWSLHRLGREQEAVQALVQACALGHAPSCAVAKRLQ